MTKYKLKEDIFFYIQNGAFTLWDYKSHAQYELTSEYVNRLISWGEGSADVHSMSEIDRELIEAGVLVQIEQKNLCEWKWDPLSKIFHIGTKNIPITFNPDASPDEWVDEYLEYCNEIKDQMPVMVTKRNGIAVEKLPNPELDALKSTSLYETLKRRKTSRKFDGNAAAIQGLSNILFSTFGLFHGEWDEFEQNGLANTAFRKSSPSGGGLHPAEAYVAVQNVDGLSPGIYHYSYTDHSLVKIGEGISDDELIALLWGQYYCKGMSFGIFITSRFDKAAWKYKHSRAYRNTILDIGHLSQTFQLSATAEKMNTWITGAFNDSAIEELLGVDGYNEGIIFFLGAGYGEDVAFDELMSERLAHFKQA